MGLNSSTVITNTIVKNTLATAVSSLQSISQQNSQFANNTQTITLNIQGKLSCADITVDQTATTTLQTLSKASASQQLTMAQQVAQSLQDHAKETLDQQNKDLNILQTNLSVVVNNAIETTQATQQVAMIQAFTQTVQQTANTTQTIVFTVGPNANVYISGSCTFSQTSSIDFTATEIVEAAMAVITTQAAVQSAATQWDTAIKQTNKGVNLALILGLVFGILALLLIIGLSVYFGWYKPRQKRRAAEGLNTPLLPKEPKAPKSPKGPKSPKSAKVHPEPIPVAKPVAPMAPRG